MDEAQAVLNGLVDQPILKEAFTEAANMAYELLQYEDFSKNHGHTPTAIVLKSLIETRSGAIEFGTELLSVLERYYLSEGELKAIIETLWTDIVEDYYEPDISETDVNTLRVAAANQAVLAFDQKIRMLEPV